MRLVAKTLFLVLLSMGLRVHAQQTRIRVVDDSDGQPVPFCHICLEDKKSGKQEYIVGDVNGTAEVTLGEDVILSVSSMGYEHFLSRDVTSSETLEVRLTPSNFGLDEVVVTGQYKPVRADKSIYNIKLIGKPRIENQAANTMAELLSKELTFKINNDPSTGSSLNLQGMSGENVKILVDGVPVIGRLDGNIDLSQLNLDNVDHIEIVEGPMSVIYGSNALAGVVNIITKQSSSARFKTGVRSYYESVGVYNVNGDAELNGDNHSLAFSGGRNFFGGYSLVDTSRSKEWKPKEQYNAGIGYLYRKDRFSVRYKTDFFREKLLDRNAAYSWPYYENGNDIWFTTLRFNNSLHLDKQLPGDNSFNLLLAHSYYWRSKQDYKIDLTTLESNLVPNPDAHDTTLFHAVVARGGFSHAREEGTLDYQFGFDVNTEYGQGKRFAHGEENIGDYALFAGLQYRPWTSLSFQPGLRASYNTRYPAPLTPSLNVKYQQGTHIFRFSYARGFRAPSLKELFLFFYDSNHQIEGNENLKAERSHNLNLGTNSSVQLWERPVEIRSKLFYNDIQDKITLVKADPENELHYRNENIDRFQSVGGDLSVSVRPNQRLTLDGGVSRIGRKGTQDSAEFYVFSTALVGNATCTFFKNRVTASLYYKFSGKYPEYVYTATEGISLRYLNPYHNMDLNASVKCFRQKVRVSAGVKNLMNNTRLSGIQGSSGHGGGDGVSSLVGWGRTFFLGIQYNFHKY